MRYPGGSYSDIYNWQTHTAAAGGYVAPNTGFAASWRTAKAVGRPAHHHRQLRHRHPRARGGLGAERV